MVRRPEQMGILHGRVRHDPHLGPAPQRAGLGTRPLDHVLLHELVHLVHHGHGPEFRQLADRHPDRVRAEGFLAGYAHGLGRAGTDAGPDQVD